MKAAEATALGKRVSELVQTGDFGAARNLLLPVLTRRTPFRALDRIGDEIGAGPLPSAIAFLESVGAEEPLGGWPVIGCALARQVDRDQSGAFERCQSFIIAADVWYATDILGERVPGLALAMDFDRALALLEPWRGNPNRWIRRAVGVGVHVWAKRSRGIPALAPRALTLLTLLEPMFEEDVLDAAKGIGWGLKTIGRFYPGELAAWLHRQVVVAGRRHRKLMLRKALTYLPPDQRSLAIGTAGFS